MTLHPEHLMHLFEISRSAEALLELHAASAQHRPKPGPTKGDDDLDGSASGGTIGAVGLADSTGSLSSREPMELRVSEDGPTRIEGCVVPYNRWTKIFDRAGAYLERVAPGAFDDVIDGDTVLLANHDSNTAVGVPLARTTSGTLQLTNGRQGLMFSAMLDTSSPIAQGAVSAVRRGDLRGCSFGFLIAQDGGETWDTGMTRRTIKRVAALRDCSVVTYPAYVAGTSVALARCATRMELDRVRAREQLRRIKSQTRTREAT